MDIFIFFFLIIFGFFFKKLWGFGIKKGKLICGNERTNINMQKQNFVIQLFLSVNKIKRVQKLRSTVFKS